MRDTHGMNAVPESSPAPANVLVRHGLMRFLGEFVPPPHQAVKRSDHVVIRTERGQELGEVLCPATPQALAVIPDPTRGEIIRVVALEDQPKITHLKEQEKKEFAAAERLIVQHRLAMQLVEVEHLFGSERIIFYFLAEQRVDFRELVKSMAREFHTRIELRQIGVRDEAKIKADYGDCGKPVCCNTHMVVMPPVSMRMAKLQKSTLDPSKISGRCGRLKCCLRFEQDVYEEFQAELPPVGCRVVTRTGQGRVLHQEILARRLLIEFEDGRRLPIPADEVLTRL
jgi:cell fate regulator YaaT (PSP1 superfamily)